jgi:hypothetical protein
MGLRKKKRRKVLARERNGENVFEHFHPRQQLDTIEDPHNKHTIEDQGCSWTTPLKNCLAAVFLLVF